MNIAISSEKTSAYEKFGKTEWRLADIEHYGESSGWKEEHLFFEAWDDDALQGILHLKCTTGVVYIESLLVGQEHRKQGIGKQLMQKAEEKARQLGAHKIFLDTGKGWQAEEFYKKLGYEKTGEHKQHYNGRDFTIFSKLLE